MYDIEFLPESTKSKERIEPHKSPHFHIFVELQEHDERDFKDESETEESESEEEEETPEEIAKKEEFRRKLLETKQGKVAAQKSVENLLSSSRSPLASPQQSKKTVSAAPGLRKALPIGIRAKDSPHHSTNDLADAAGGSGTVDESPITPEQSRSKFASNERLSEAVPSPSTKRSNPNLAKTSSPAAVAASGEPKKFAVVEAPASIKKQAVKTAASSASAFKGVDKIASTQAPTKIAAPSANTPSFKVTINPTKPLVAPGLAVMGSSSIQSSVSSAPVVGLTRSSSTRKPAGAAPNLAARPSIRRAPKTSVRSPVAEGAEYATKTNDPEWMNKLKDLKSNPTPQE